MNSVTVHVTNTASSLYKVESHRIESGLESNRIVFFSGESPITSFWRSLAPAIGRSCRRFNSDHGSFSATNQILMAVLPIDSAKIYPEVAQMNTTTSTHVSLFLRDKQMDYVADERAI